MNHNAAMPADKIATGIAKIAEIPRRLEDIDKSLGILQSTIEDLGMKIGPVMRESEPAAPSPLQTTLPPSVSQLEAALYSFNVRIECAIDILNHLHQRVAL